MKQLGPNVTGQPDPWNVPVKNTTGEIIPAHSAMQVIGSTPVDGDTLYFVTKPTGITNAKYLINSPANIEANSEGWGTDQYPTTAAIAGSFSVGQEIGPTLGSWALTANGVGYLFLGGAASDFGRVASKSVGGGQSADFPVIFLRNDSTLPRPAWSVFKTGVPLTPVPNAPIQPLFTTLPPVENESFAVSFADVGVSEINNIVAAAQIGPVLVQLNFTDFAHTKAECITGDYTKLKSGTAGRGTILWREKQHIIGSATLGLQWAYVLLDATSGAAAPNLFMCTLYSNIAAASLGGAGSGQGNVYSISPTGGFTLLGERGLFNPFQISIPSIAASVLIQYTCVKTFTAAQPEDDRFTISGLDPLHIAASRPGFARKKAFAVKDGISVPTVADMEWLGKECPEE